MTEEEARTKWCPFVRVGSTISGLGALNRDVHGNTFNDAALCVASNCMAWRWNDTLNTAHDSPNIFERVYVNGFCGLAGTP